MNTKTFAGSSLLMFSAFTAGGCAADVDLVRQGKVTAQSVDSSALTLGKPRVEQREHRLHITGDVRRPDFTPMHGGGHVHVQLLDAAGESVQSTIVPYSLPPGRKTPRIPGPRSASYHANLPGQLPNVGTVRVVACSETHPPAKAQE